MNMENCQWAWQENSGVDFSQEWTLDQLADQFDKAVGLCQVTGDEEPTDDANCEPSNEHNCDDSDEDPEPAQKISSPYKSKYMARINLIEMKSALLKLLENDIFENKKDDKELMKDRLHAINHQLGVIAVAVQEPTTGEEHFSRIVSSLESSCYEERHIVLYVSSLNQLGLVWAERLDMAKAQSYLLKASEAYKDFKDLHSQKTPIPIQSLFIELPWEDPFGKNKSNIVTVADEEKPPVVGTWEDLEQLHTYTLYYLAQISEKMGEHEDAARYCHATLHRQLADTAAFDYLDWSKNAAFLASFYYSRKDYKTGRYLLSASWGVLTANALPGVDQTTEKTVTVKSDVAMLVGSFCLKLLQDSIDAAEGEEGDPVPPAPSQSASAQWEKKNFDGLDKNVIESIENELPCELATTFTEASQTFKAGLQFLQTAANHYTLEDHASKNIEVVQGMSKLYQSLAAFEPAPDRQSKMHKRRVDMIMQLLEELSPQFYLQSCRQLRFELAETYGSMASCKEGVDPMALTQTQRNKVTQLTISSIAQYKLFLETFKTHEGVQPTQYPEEVERAAVVAYFHIGRLYSRIKSNDRELLIDNIKKAVANFKEVLDYVKRNPSSQEKISEEYELCKEMSELLPMKMHRLANGAQTW